MGLGIDVSVYVVVLILSAIFLGISGFIYLRNRNFLTDSTRKTPGRRSGPQQRPDGPRGAVRRRPPRQAAQRMMEEEAAAAVHSDSENSASDVESTSKSGAKIGKKKALKLEQKALKKKEREEEERIREENKKVEEEKKAERRMREEEEEAATEEAERLVKEEQERQEREAYEALKAEFSIEEEGEDEAAQAARGLDEFLDAIRKQKVVMLEELAEQFDLRTGDCIDRVKTLQTEGRLSGVMDDRGKFIYITSDEYAAVAKFVRRRGRVTVRELADNSNKLIQLDTCAEVTS